MKPGITVSASRKGGSSGSATVTDGAAIALFTDAVEKLGESVGVGLGLLVLIALGVCAVAGRR